LASFLDVSFCTEGSGPWNHDTKHSSTFSRSCAPYGIHMSS
jgi:hypothetical protein